MFPLQAKPATPSAPSASVATKRSLYTSPSAVPRQKKSSSAASRSRNTSSARKTSPRRATSASAFQNTSTWASSTTRRLVSTEWTSTAVWDGRAQESRDGDVRRPELARAILSAGMIRSSGSRRDSRVLSDSGGICLEGNESGERRDTGRAKSSKVAIVIFICDQDSDVDATLVPRADRCLDENDKHTSANRKWTDLQMRRA